MSTITTRKAIRKKVVDMLIEANLPSVGSNIFSSRTEAFYREELPSISVFTTDETAEPRGMSGTDFTRTMNLRVEIHAEGNTNLDDTLDDLAEDVENVLYADLSLGGLSVGVLYRGANIELAGDEAVKIVGVLTMDWEIKYIN